MADEGQIQEIKRHCNFDIKNFVRGKAKPIVAQLSCTYWCLFSRATLYNTYASPSSLLLYVHLRLAFYMNVASNNQVMNFHSDKRFGLLSIGQRMEGNSLEQWGNLWPVYPHCIRYWISWSSIVSKFQPLSANLLFINVFKLSFDWTKGELN
jgi:hypothetical protein